MPDMLMSQAEYARHRAKSRQYISRLAKAGVLVMRGGKVDANASDAVLDDRPEPVSERVVSAPAEVTPSGASFAQARTADMVFKAKLRWSAIYRLIVDRILAWPNRLAPEVAALTDERQVREAILREVRALVNELRADVQYAR